MKRTAGQFARWLGAAAISFMAITSAQALTDQEKAIAERIKPAGQVCLEGDAACAAAAPTGGKKTGEEVFTTVCTTCHTAGVLGAPKVGDKEAWAPRIGQGMDTLVQHALNGIRSMPPKGTCATCSDDEIKGAVKYMTDKSK